MKIYDAKVNHLTNPVGFRMDHVVFSWKVSEAKGKEQKTARIIVALDEEFQRIIFDTKEKRELSSLGVEADISLQPRTRYYWHVEVTSNCDEFATSDIMFFETGKMSEKWEAKWISCKKNEGRLPIFSKEIDLKKKVAKGRLYICGLGLYDVSFNGNLLSDEFMTPYCNDYNEWVQYQTFDITAQLKSKGTIDVTLGNGWYKARFGFNSAHETKGFYGDEFKLIAEMHIEYEDGTKEIVVTDESWDVKRSNITFSTIYDGEWVDETLQILPVEEVHICSAPKGILTERMSPKVQKREVFSPIEVIHTPAGETVLDMGQEFTGIFELKINEPKGSKIHIQTGEILQNGNFYNENLRSAKSEYYFVTSGGEKVIRPRFTFFGYRYVKIEGVKNLSKDDFQGIAFYSELESLGSITTGHELVNKFISNVEWGLKSNFLDVPTDCPQRDERMGWTGDAQVFSPTALYLKDCYGFYAKYLYDMKLEQQSREGMVPDVIPTFGVETTACVWGDAATIIPWNLYVFYGDSTILKNQYESMKGWVDYIKKVDGDNHNWRYQTHYGDWLALDNMAGNKEAVYGATDEEFIANLYYAISAEIVSKAAKILGKSEDEHYYSNLAKEQYDVVREEYYSATGRCCIKTQTALLLTLKYNLSGNRELVLKQLDELFEKNNDHLTTGFVGTPLMNNILTENGRVDLAYKLLLNEDYPGWLREVKLGATTVWERWNSLLDDGTISGISMNSMNHYSYGSVLEWMFRYVAGINVAENYPGANTVYITPNLNWTVGSVTSYYDSASGRYEVDWKLTDPEHVEIRIKIPFGCKAFITLPHSGKAQFEVCSGEYFYNYMLTRSLKKIYNLDTPIRILKERDDIVAAIQKWIDFKEIPQQFLSVSINELYKKYKGLSLEDRNEIEKILAQF